MKLTAFLAAAAALVFVAVVVASGAGWNPFGVRWNFQNSGAFGDSFGVIGAMMASIAAIAAVAAYRTQSAELRAARARESTQQNSSDQRDFESTFFNLLQLIRDTVREVSVPDKYGLDPVSGKEALRRIYDFIGDEAFSPGKNASDSFKKFHTRFRDELAHYFRLVYHVLKFINESRVSEKRRYVGFFRATLTEGELGLIALNCMYGAGKRKLKPLVEEYALLHNISDWSASHWHMLDIIDVKAFGDRNIRRAVEKFDQSGKSEVDQLD